MRFPLKLFTFCICIFFVGSAYSQSMRVSCPSFAKYYLKDSINVVTFGASTVQGVRGTNFQAPLANFFSNCYKDKVINVENYGVGGETTERCLLRIDTALYGKTGFIVILVGLNDAVLMEAGKMNIKETEDNMRKIIVSSLNQQLIPIICTIQYNINKTDERSKRINYYVRRINDLYKKLNAEYHTYLADVNAILAKDKSLYQDDIHPNANGNRLIAFLLFETINKIIADKFLPYLPPGQSFTDTDYDFSKFSISQNYPNPTKTGYARVDVIMPQEDRLMINIYNIYGKLVKTISTDVLRIGKHILNIDLSMQPPGIYIYKTKSISGPFSSTKKLIISR